jgi:parallel beta-helix repeat protein
MVQQLLYVSLLILLLPVCAAASYASTVLSLGPKALWMFDDTDTTLSDFSGNGQKGGYFGMYEQSQQPIIPDETNPPCVRWPGVTGSHAFVPNSALLNLQTLTFVIWVKYAGKIDGGTSFAVIASQDLRRPGKYGWELLRNNAVSGGGADTMLQYSNSAGILVTAATFGNLYDGNAHMVAVAFDGGNVYWSVDGAAKSSVAKVGTVSFGNYGLLFGEFPGGGFNFTGYEAGAALFNRVLSDQNIAALYTAGGVSTQRQGAFYVDPGGSDSNSGAISAPWKTIGHAARTATLAGDIVHVNDGTYLETIVLNKSGLRGAPITFQATHRRGAKIVGTGANTLTLNANWLVINGFEVTGDKYCVVSSVTQHTIVENNLIHNCGASGIQLNGGDYVTIQGNTVYKCAFTSADDGSGISIYEPVAADGASGFHSVIQQNISYLNDNHAGRISDGNGILMDDFLHTQSDNIPYAPATLVQNNLVYGNGGWGIKAFESNNITFRNNTAYWDHLRNDSFTHYAELGDQRSSNNTWYNNIGWANSRGRSNSTDAAIGDVGFANTGNAWLNNLSYNGVSGASSLLIEGSTARVTKANGNLLGEKPLLVSPRTSGNGNFQETASSPTIRAGTTSMAPPLAGVSSTDLAGDPRSHSGFVDIGAYQFRRSIVGDEASDRRHKRR